MGFVAFFIAQGARLTLVARSICIYAEVKKIRAMKGKKLAQRRTRTRKRSALRGGRLVFQTQKGSERIGTEQR